ncbi:MAG: hypothetical protein HW412_1818 [Bacteroidetes bacterium]|nr:hypothetical protein [Bacteroidota bacterium]
MIICTVCGQQNDELAVLCFSCRSYLQSKVDNLNLFETIWLLIENPKTAFKKIILSQHKNYVYLLSSMFGVSFAFGLFWLGNLGPQFTNLLTLIGSAALFGIPFGLIFIVALSLFTVRVARFFGGKISVRNTMAVVTYASVPIVLSLVFIFPLEIAIFGIDFFGKNPSPLVIKPEAYIALLVFDGLAILWTFLLLFRGLMVLTGFPKGKSMILTLVAGLMPGAFSLGISLFSNTDVH